MRQQHSRLIDSILLAVGREYPTEVVLFQNPVGLIRINKLYRTLLKIVPEKVLRPIFVGLGIRPETVIRYGLCRGSSDIIGCSFGSFLALEVKVGDDSLKEDQKVFFRAVARTGGLAREVRSVEDALEAVAETMRRKKG